MCYHLYKFTSLFIQRVFTPAGHKPMWQFTEYVDNSTIELYNII